MGRALVARGPQPAETIIQVWVAKSAHAGVGSRDRTLRTRVQGPVSKLFGLIGTSMVARAAHCYPLPMQYMDVLAQVVDQSGGAEPWYKAAAGIIAVPVAILGFAYSFVLMKKTRLESRKLELDLAKDEAILRAAVESAPGTEDQGKLTSLVAQPLIEGRRIQEIVLRFIILYLVLEAWRIFDRVFEFTTGFGVLAINGIDSPVVQDIGYVIYQIVDNLPTATYYVLLLGLGGPILMGCLKHLHITPSQKFVWLESPPRIAYLIVAGIILGMAFFRALIGVYL